MEPSYYPLRSRLHHNGGVDSRIELLQVIRDEIEACGPMTFERYVELALYHPQLGYYRTADRFGRRGDFYTAEQLQPVFGELIASYVEKLTKIGAVTMPPAVLELGAGRGEMREALAQWRYRAFDWYSPELPQTWRGVVFANEFFDSLPFHILRKSKGNWHEVFVVWGRNGLVFESGKPMTGDLAAYAEAYGAPLPEGGYLEACLELEAWCRRLGTILREGRLLVIDYGYDAHELARFPEGTMLSYSRHYAHSDLLANPGARDITAHVNFTWMRRCCEAAGFKLERSLPLAAWVLSVWDEEELGRRWAHASQRWKLQWKQIAFELGETFSVVELVKNEAADPMGNKKAPDRSGA